MGRAAFTLTWGVKGPVRVLILTGASGQPPEDLLDAARDAFQSPLNFEVRVKLHPIRYNPSGRLLARFREELRHWFHMEHPWWWMLGVSGRGRMFPHWTFLKSRGWKDSSVFKHLAWADVVIYDTTSLWQHAVCPVIHWIGRERQWRFNPGETAECGDPLILRYMAYEMGRCTAKYRGLEVWRRSNGSPLILKEYGAI